MATKKKGIDISEHQGKLNFEKLKSAVDFIIIRGGYGNTIDSYAVRNITECERLKIPYGIYWFSYALNPSDAKAEANRLCDLADRYNPTYPLCFDFEYDSDRYAKQYCGVNLTNADRAKIACAFLETIENRNYYAVIYTNIDYMSKGFSYDTIGKYDIWLAQWGVSSPSKTCGMWQYGADNFGEYSNLDADISYVDYPYYINKNGLHGKNKKSTSTTTTKDDKKTETTKPKKDKTTIVNNSVNYFKKNKASKYYDKAQQVIAGKYKTGNERKKLLNVEGYDYDIVQNIVNDILG